jgi:hypothetical protein
MKHIKLFLEGFDKSEYYHEIDVDEYDSCFGLIDDYYVEQEYKIVDIDEKYLDILKNRSIGKLEFEIYSDISVSELKINKKMAIGIYSDIGSIKIYEISDEWFVVYVADVLKKETDDFETFYKCDQFDGLVELLKDRGVIR